MRFDLLARPQPFIGILLAVSGWALSHQVGSDSVFDNCTRGGAFVVVVSLIGLVITALGGLYCFMAWRGTDRGRSFLGILGALLALIAGFAIVLQIAAGLILPECAA
jgi:uncharacterized membrane protein